MIRTATLEDAAAITRIYNHYIEHTIATFEEQPVVEATMAERIREVSREFPWLVAVNDGEVLGYAYANRWKLRSAYRYSVESTIYLDPQVIGRGIGRALYMELIEAVRQRGAHCVIGGISLPNAASVALHEKLGFTKVAHFKQVGWKLERWVDVGYWQLVLASVPSP